MSTTVWFTVEQSGQANLFGGANERGQRNGFIEDKQLKRLPEEIVQASENAGATAGWMGLDEYGYLQFTRDANYTGCQ